MTISPNSDRVHCDKLTEGLEQCRKSVSMKAIEQELPRADGWRVLTAGPNASHSLSHLCPLHGLELDDWLNEVEVEQSVRRRAATKR